MTAPLALFAALGLSLIAVAAGEAATTPASKGTRVPGGAKAGTPCYVDREYRLVSLPSVLDGGDLVRTANDDDYAAAEDYLTLDLACESTVYVCYSAEASELPAWLKQEGWSRASGQARVQIGGEKKAFNLFVRTAPKGRLALGGNSRARTGAVCTYFVVITGSKDELKPPQTSFRLLFSGQQDVSDTWGKLHFGTTPLRRLRDCENPGFELSYCQPLSNGVWDVYGLSFREVSKHDDQARVTNAWSVVHATTRDAVSFENVETVFEAEPGPWTFNHALTYNPEAKEFLLLKLKIDNSGFQYTAFFSPDGRSWKQHPQAPLFYDGDAISLFWSPVLHRFVLVSKSLQPVPGGGKRIADHGGKNRRVIAFRTSPDGRVWEPSDSMEDVWNRGGRWRPRPDAVLTVPDALDPPDLEFYSGNGFWYRDRCYLMVLNYATSPLSVRKHAPQMDTEWWAGRDGLLWERPGRNVNALGDSFPSNARITHNPLLLNAQILFRFGGSLAGMRQDRLSFVGARANAEFSTVLFTMPAGDLLLNAACPSPDRLFATQQAYIMAAVLDDTGAVVPGFEQDTCVLQKAEAIDLPLLWSGKSARELSGKSIRLRFYLRSANIYAVSVKE